jgi:hypothetical protein
MVEPPVTGSMSHATPSEPTPSETIRAQALKGQIGTRLRKVCSHLSDEQFAELVDDITAVTLKYEERPRLAQSISSRRAD